MDAGGDISDFRHMPTLFWASKKIRLAWTGNALKNGKNDTKSKKKKGLFGEALILTTSHLVHLPPCGFGDYIINEWS